MAFVDFPTLVRPDRPNTYLLAPDGLCQTATPDQISPVWAKSPHDVYAALLAVIENQSLWRIAGQSPDALHVAFTARTRVMRFTDDIDAVVLPLGHDDDASSQIAIYSRSRIGYSDLGANAKRVSKILDLLPEPKS